MQIYSVPNIRPAIEIMEELETQRIDTIRFLATDDQIARDLLANYSQPHPCHITKRLYNAHT